MNFTALTRSALVAAGVLDFAEAVDLVRFRGEVMRDAVPDGQGGMAAVIGLDDAALIEACREAAGDQVAEAVNFNAPGQVVISGTAAAGGIALINSVGNLGGFVGPYVVGLIKDRTHSNVPALLFLGSALLGMGLLALMIRPVKAREK